MAGGFEKSRTPTIQQTYDKQAQGADTTLDIAQDAVFDIRGNDVGGVYNAIRITPSDIGDSETQVDFSGNQSIRYPTLIRHPITTIYRMNAAATTQLT